MNDHILTSYLLHPRVCFELTIDQRPVGLIAQLVRALHRYSQRSWVRFPFRPEFFSGLIFNASVGCRPFSKVGTQKNLDFPNDLAWFIVQMGDEVKKVKSKTPWLFAIRAFENTVEKVNISFSICSRICNKTNITSSSG